VLLSEHLDVLFTGQEEIQEVQPLILACLANAKQHKVFLYATLRRRTLNDIPQLGQCLYSMFSIVVVPGNSVVLKKCEKLVSLLGPAHPRASWGKLGPKILRHPAPRPQINRPGSRQGNSGVVHRDWVGPSLHFDAAEHQRTTVNVLEPVMRKCYAKWVLLL
jgi:hypothetical protein